MRIRKEIRPKMAEIRTWLRDSLFNQRLAPGRLVGDPSLIVSDRYYLMHLADRYGPVFKIWNKGKITICIVGPELGSRFLKESRGKVKNAVHDMSYVFPLGFIRGMEGETHRHYKRLLVSAFSSVTAASQEPEIRSTIGTCLDDQIAGDRSVDGSALKTMAKKIATGLMIRLILGVDALSPTGQRIAALADEYSPDGMDRHVHGGRLAAFRKLQQHVRQRTSLEGTTECAGSIVDYLRGKVDVDETLTGNLVQMLELGRFDLQGLLRWVIVEVAAQPAFMNRLAQEPDTAAPLAAAAVRETLRMHQSEYLARVATQAITFEGYYFPKNSAVRICIWEGHRDPDKFASPEIFRPERFVGTKWAMKDYAPFGLDHHQCPGADWTRDIAALLVLELASRYAIRIVRQGTPQLAKFHFEPGHGTMLHFTPRPRTSPDAP